MDMSALYTNENRVTEKAVMFALLVFSRKLPVISFSVKSSLISCAIKSSCVAVPGIHKLHKTRCWLHVMDNRLPSDSCLAIYRLLSDDCYAIYGLLSNSCYGLYGLPYDCYAIYDNCDIYLMAETHQIKYKLTIHVVNLSLWTTENRRSATL